MTGPGWFPLVAAQSLAVGAGLLALGWLLAGVPFRRRPVDGLGRAALALPALVAWALVLMIAHVLTRGAVLGNAWLVRGLTAAAAVGALGVMLRRRRGRERPLAATVLLLAAVALLAVAVWGLPVLRTDPLVPTKDITWHMGWAGQLLNGEPTPTAPITGEIPNYYPWMFHALVAFASAFTPGGHPYATLAPLQIVMVAGAALAFFGLGRALGGPAAGFGVALFAVVAGGYGFALASGPDVLIGPPFGGPRGAETYGGDLLFVRSPNAAFGNLAPPLSRDLGYALLPAFLLLLVDATRRVDAVRAVAAGAVLGLIGLTTGEWFFAGIAAVVVAAAIAPRASWGRVAAGVLGPALGLWALWAVPLLASYLRLGGFVNTTVIEPVELSFAAMLVAWGVATPFAVFGAAAVLARFRRSDAATVVPVAFAVAAAALLAGAGAVAGVLGEGFGVLGRAHRYWPVVGAAVAVLAGLGLGELVRRAGARARAAGAAVAALAVVLALPSPVFASAALGWKGPRSADVREALREPEPTLLAAVASAGRGRCIVAAPLEETFRLFGYTGYRFVALEQPARPGALRGNLSRVRWKDIYEHVPPDEPRIADVDRLLAEGTPPAEARAIVARRGIDVVVVPDGVVPPGLVGYESIGEPPGFRVLRTGDRCGT